ncbi:MAG: helix-turn-helix domain-containing protein [Clostridia bacterium]|nr:helix-turn-helix domain-containing protein [Clostridia bacterium]
MNLQIGQTIRDLRARANITQEKLANHLGVSVQAVSRWESGKCYPDLELIPSLAIFFGVSTDVILCIDKTIVTEAVDDIIKKWRNTYKTGDFDKALSIVTEGLLAYPLSYQLMASKAKTELIFIEIALDTNDQKRADNYVKSCRDTLYKILNECKEEDVRADTRNYLIGLELWLKNYNQFQALTENLSDVKSSKNSMLYRFHPEPADSANYARKYIYELLFELIYCLLHRSRSELIDNNTRTTFNLQILNLLETYVGGPIYGEFEFLLDEVYTNLYNSTGIIEYKNEIGKHVEIYNNLPDKFEYSSPFLKGYVFSVSDAIHAIDGSLK